MAKNNYKMNVNQYANQEEARRKAKGNPNKNNHGKKKNSNYGGYNPSGAGAYMANRLAAKASKQEHVKLPMWLNIVLIAEFAAVLITLILRMSAYKDSVMLTHLSSLLLGVTCGTLFYVRKYKHQKKNGGLYAIITIVLVVLCLFYTTFGILGLFGFLG